MSATISTADPVSPGTAQFGPLQRLGRFARQEAAQGNGAAVGSALAQAIESQFSQGGDHVTLSQAVGGLNQVLRQTGSQLGVAAPQLVDPTSPAAVATDLQSIRQTLTNLTAQGKTISTLQAFDANAAADAAGKGITLQPGILNTIVNQTIATVQNAAPQPLNVIG